MADDEEFERIRAEVCASGPASDGDNLVGMEIDCCAYLGDPTFPGNAPSLWHGMTVRRSQGAEWLVTGRAVGRLSHAPAVADELSTIWEEHLRYRYRSAHTVRTTPRSVLFRAVTQIDPGEFWVTVDVEVALT